MIESLVNSVRWDPLDANRGSGGGGVGGSSGDSGGGNLLSAGLVFDIYEALEANRRNNNSGGMTEATHHHHHRPRAMLRKRTDLAAYVAGRNEVVRMTGAHNDP